MLATPLKGVSKFEEGITGIVNPLSENQTGNCLFIFPNPSIKQTAILFPNKGTYALYITNMMGKTLKQFFVSGEKTIIQTENMESGIYLISLKGLSSSIMFHGKLIIKK
jgi:hypothetical protein